MKNWIHFLDCSRVNRLQLCTSIVSYPSLVLSGKHTPCALTCVQKGAYQSRERSVCASAATQGTGVDVAHKGEQKVGRAARSLQD